jgi:cardiolipin synthase
MPPRAGLRALPNIISSSRVVLAVGFVAANDVDTRLALVGFAAITDFLDGWIARRGQWITRSGAMLDAFADRVFVLVAVSTFLFTGELSTGAYFVMISRDLATAVGFLVARIVPWLRPVAFKARSAGKLVTVLQLLTFIAILRLPAAVTPLLWTVGAASVAAIVDYTLALWRARAS